MERHKKAKQTQSGRTMVEILGVLALLILLTWGGIQVFGLVYASVVSKALNENVIMEASIRRHEHMKKAPSGKNEIDRKGPYGYQMHIEDGISGNLEDAFWVSLLLQDGGYKKRVCNKLLERSKNDGMNAKNGEWLGFIGVSVDEKVVEECPEEAKEVKYLFSKRGSGGAQTVVCYNACCQLCPMGGICDENSITCEPGYKWVPIGLCGKGDCVKCRGRECCGPGCPEHECQEGTKPTENNDACPTCDKTDDPNECCPNGGLPNGEGSCDCDEEMDCSGQKCYKCDSNTNKCVRYDQSEPCPDCENNACYDYDKKICITCKTYCTTGKNCEKCQKCEGGQCSTVAGCPDTPQSCTTRDDCGGQCVECTEDKCVEIADKATTCPDCPPETPCWDKENQECIVCEDGCETDEDCNGNMICDPTNKICVCPEGAELNTETKQCDCLENQYLSIDGKECLPCVTDATAQKGDNICTCTTEGIIWNIETNTCVTMECAYWPIMNAEELSALQQLCTDSIMQQSGAFYEYCKIAFGSRVSATIAMMKLDHNQSCGNKHPQKLSDDRWWAPTISTGLWCVCPVPGVVGKNPDREWQNAIHEACEAAEFRDMWGRNTYPDECGWTMGSNGYHPAWGKSVEGRKYTVETFQEEAGMCGNCWDDCDCGSNAKCHLHYCHCEPGWRELSSGNGNCVMCSPGEDCCADGWVASGEGGCVQCKNGDCMCRGEELPGSVELASGATLYCIINEKNVCMADPCEEGCLCAKARGTNCPVGSVAMGDECCQEDQVIEKEGYQECCDGTVYTNTSGNKECCPEEMQVRDNECVKECTLPMTWDSEKQQCGCPDGGENRNGTCCKYGAEYDEHSTCWAGDGDTHYCKVNIPVCDCYPGTTQTTDGGCCMGGYYDDGTQMLGFGGGWSFGANKVTQCHACGYGTHVTTDEGEYCCNEYGADISSCNGNIYEGDNSCHGGKNYTAVCCEAMNVDSEECCTAKGGTWENSTGDGICCSSTKAGYLLDSDETDFEHCGCPVDSQGHEGSWTTDYNPNGACCIDGYAYNERTQDFDLIDRSKCGCPYGSREPYSDVPSECAEEVCCVSEGWAYVSGKGRGTTEPNTLSCGCYDDTDYYTRCGYYADFSITWINIHNGSCVRDCCPFPQSYNGRSECCYDTSTGCYGYDSEVCCMGAGYSWNNGVCCNGDKAWNTSCSDGNGSHWCGRNIQACGCPPGTTEHHGVCCGSDNWAIDEDQKYYIDTECGCPRPFTAAKYGNACCNEYGEEIDSQGWPRSEDSAACCPGGYATESHTCCEGRETQYQSCCERSGQTWHDEYATGWQCGDDCPSGSTRINGACCSDTNKGYEANGTQNYAVCGCPTGYTWTENTICCDDAQPAYDISGKLNPVCGCPEGSEKRNGVCCSLAQPGRNIAGVAVMACCPDENKICARSGNRSDKCVCNVEKPKTACSPYACIACESNETALCSAQVYSTQSYSRPCICYNPTTQNGVCSSSGQCTVCDKPLTAKCITEGCVCYNSTTQNVGCNSWAGGCTVCDKPKTVDARNRKCLDP